VFFELCPVWLLSTLSVGFFFITALRNYVTLSHSRDCVLTLLAWCAAGSMQRYSACPSVCLSVCLSHLSVSSATRRTTLGDRAFPVTAARSWNALPSSVRSAPSLLQFCRDLKTALHVSVIVLFAIVFGCVTDCNCNL